MKPVEFVMFMRGAIAMADDEMPTKEQWRKVKEAAELAVGTLVASKFLEEAEQSAAEKKRQQAYAHQAPFVGIGTGGAGTLGAGSIVPVTTTSTTSGMWSTVMSALGGGK